MPLGSQPHPLGLIILFLANKPSDVLGGILIPSAIGTQATLSPCALNMQEAEFWEDGDPADPLTEPICREAALGAQSREGAS